MCPNTLDSRDLTRRCLLNCGFKLKKNSKINGCWILMNVGDYIIERDLD